MFDKNGNLTTDAENRATTFNGDNKQTKVIQNGQLVGEYFYDGEGKRVKKKVYDPNNPGVVTDETIFVYSSGKLIAEYSTKPPPPNPTTSYTATDMLGSPRVITNALGEVTSRRDFMPFGEQVYSEPSYRPTSLKYNTGDDLRQKFTGYQKDEETQLDFAEARMYQNKHGRFTAIDPLLASGRSANPQTFNRYAYVMNNPLAYTDPTGLQVARHRGEVYVNAAGDEYAQQRLDGFEPYRGPEILFFGTGNYWWLIRQGGWDRLGKFEGKPVEVRAAPELVEESPATPIGNITPRQGVEFMSGNNLSDEDRSVLANETTDMLSMPGCRQSFLDSGLRDPMTQKFFVGSVSQLSNGSSAASLGLTDEGLTTSRQAYNDSASSLNEVTASNSLQWLGQGNARTIDDNPRMFVAPANFFGQRSYSPFAWSSRTNTVHGRQHGAGAPGGTETSFSSWLKPWTYFRHDLYYTRPRHDNIIQACTR
ncbi:MAG: RHS repeat domain-containing protein [Pyrinomonadaceae bacterium]